MAQRRGDCQRHHMVEAMVDLSHVQVEARSRLTESKFLLSSWTTLLARTAPMRASTAPEMNESLMVYVTLLTQCSRRVATCCRSELAISVSSSQRGQ